MSLNNKSVEMNDAQAIGKIFDGMNANLRRTYQTSFGEAMSNVDVNTKKNIVELAANIGFGADLKATRGESGIATSAGVNAESKNKLITEMYKEYIARGESLISRAGESFAANGVPSQAGPIHTTMDANTQMLLMALVPSIIKPIHNKVVKSIVTKGLQFNRIAQTPYVIDEQGKEYDYYELLNDRELLDNISDGGQPLIRLHVELTAADTLVKANLCDMWNQQLTVANPHNYAQFKTITDFIARGIKISKVYIEDAGKVKAYPVEYKTTGYNVQSGGVNTTVANIDLTVENKDGKKLSLMGTIKADGSTILTAVGADGVFIKGVDFEFVIPAKGAQNTLRTVYRETPMTVFIQKKAAHAMTLNAQLLDDFELKYGKDLVTMFNDQVVTMTNAQKDQALLKYIDRQVSDLAMADAAANKFENKESVLSRYNYFSTSTIDMNTFNPGMMSFVDAASAALAKGMFDVTNYLDVKLRPNVPNFSIVSSSTAAQWIKDNNNNTGVVFKITGQATDTDSTIAGIVTPYTLNNINIGNNYHGTYITTNRIESKETTRDMLDNAANQVTGIAKEHTFYVIPRFEENLDSILFLHGLERVTEGVNDIEFTRDKTLQYETRYDITSFNKSLGLLKFIEAPTNMNFKK